MTNSAVNTISVINTSNNMVVDTIPVGMGPVSVAHDPVNGEVYITNQDDNTISVIATLPVANAGSNQTKQSF